MLERYRPDIIVPRLEFLDQDELQARGLRGIVLDLDNTICQWHGSEPGPERREWVARAKERFSLCILSNTIKGRRLRRIGADLGLPTVARWAYGRKPMAEGYRAAMRHTATEPVQTAMVGDQLLTDIAGANRLGMTSVWALPLSRHEFISTKVARAFERVIVRRLGLDLSPYQARAAEEATDGQP
jgi:HAD superfamily phosphatase (TIGR01668 family)